MCLLSRRHLLLEKKPCSQVQKFEGHILAVSAMDLLEAV